MTIPEQRMDILLAQEYETAIYKEKINELNSKLKAIQNLCPHEELDYHPDPSGNNDSYWSCKACHKEGKQHEFHPPAYLGISEVESKEQE